MAYRSLELTLISAKDLKDVNFMSRMEVYAVISLTSDPRVAPLRTDADRAGGTSPTWNKTLRFNIPAYPAGGSDAVHIVLRTGSSFSDRDVGEVYIPLKGILSDVGGDGPSPQKFVSYQVRKGQSGKPHGIINVSYKVGEVITAAAGDWPPSGVAMASGSGYSTTPPSGYPKPSAGSAPVAAAPYPPPSAPAVYPPPAAGRYPPPSSAAGDYPPPKVGKSDPVMAYPAYPAAGSSTPPSPAQPYPAQPYNPSAYNYPPQPPAYGGYGYPPPPYAYAAPPPQYVYAAPPQQPQRSNFGLGVGAGLLGGAVGGLLLGEALDSSYDAGFDAGYDDGGGFF